MTHNEGAMNFIKQESTNKLSYYNKVIPNLPHSIGELINKAENIRKKNGCK